MRFGLVAVAACGRIEFDAIDYVLRTGSRYFYVPVSRIGDIGFRCARVAQ